MRTLGTFLVVWCLLSVLVVLVWGAYWQMREREQERRLRQLQHAWRREVERRGRDAA